MEITWLEVHCSDGPRMRIFHDKVLSTIIRDKVSEHLKLTFDKVFARTYSSKIQYDQIDKFKFHIWKLTESPDEILRNIDYYINASERNDMEEETVCNAIDWNFK